MNTVTVLAEALLQLVMSDCPAGTTHFAASIRRTCRYASATEVSVSWYRKRKDGGFDEFSDDYEDAGIDAKWMHNDLVKNPIQLYAGEAAMAQEAGEAMSDLEILRPEVREAVHAIDHGNGVFVDSDDSIGAEKWRIVRAELPRLAGDLNAARLSSETFEAKYQCMRERATKAEAELLRLADENARLQYEVESRDTLLGTINNTIRGWEARAEKADVELAALKERIAEAPIIHAEKTWRGTLFVSLPQHDVDLLDGKRVRLVVEE